MRVRIREGLPVEEDIVRALDGFCETKFVKKRNELFLNKCPLCADTDNRGTGVQGAISYSLTKHCVVCAKCGKSAGWKETLAGIGVEWEVEGKGRPGSSFGDEIRKELKIDTKKRDDKEREYVDHGDYGLDVSVAADHHIRRMMSPDSKVRPWLEARGFKFADDYAENLGEAWAGECKAGWLVLIYRRADGKIRGFKYRNIVTKEFWAQAGAQSEPWGIHEIDESNPTITWVEGELDRETLKQVYGIPNVISLPNGSNSWKPDWATKYMQHARTCYIGTDHDEEGEKVAAKMFADMPSLGLPELQGILRLRFIDKNEQRVKDANDALIGGATMEQVKACYLGAEDPDLVQSERAELNSSGYFTPTGWHFYDQVAGGGVLSGEVTHLAGAPKSGKTTLVVDLHRRLASRGVKTGFVSLDMATSKIAVRFGMALLNKDDSHFYRSSGEEREALVQQMGSALAVQHKGLVLFTRDKRISSYREALAAIERMARSGAKVITVEDFLSLSVFLEEETKGRTVYAGRRIIGDLSQIATRCSCHVILVNHLKIDDRGGQAYGAGQIGPSAQMNVHVSPERDENGFVRSTIVHVRENRFGPQADVDISFTFDEKSTERTLVTSPPVRHKAIRFRPKKKSKPKPPDSGSGPVEDPSGGILPF